MDSSSSRSPRGSLLVLSSLGVVFGDIGTSPLYALRECLDPAHGSPQTPFAIIGIVSLLIWTLVLVVGIKYLMFVLRADNRGEGGILALVSLIRHPVAVGAGILGAALLYADGALTPAVSVLSALEGLTVVSPEVQGWIPSISIVVLAVLFWFQSRGTGSVSGLFGPVIVVWFVVIAVLGLLAILQEPGILMALNPLQAIEFSVQNPLLTFSLLGFVFLAVTGAEALYADLGHFGKRPIRLAWNLLAFPALLLSYLGQGAVVLLDPSKTSNLFFQLAPRWFLIPLVVLSTVATIIASQAVITGAFSLARQSVQLGLWPRLKILHTSTETLGQVYVPFINGCLFVGTVLLVLGFRESSNLADAYGVAVSGTMLLTTILLAVAARRLWKTPWSILIPLATFFFALDAVFFAANSTKLLSGGWVVVLVALVLGTMMFTWTKGRALFRERQSTKKLAVPDFVASVRHSSQPYHRVDRMGVFLSATPESVPPSLLHNLKHNRMLHRPTVLVTVSTEELPVVSPPDRCLVKDCGEGVWVVQLKYGFSESPDVPRALGTIEQLPFQPETASYFLGKQTLVVGHHSGTMAVWRKRLFAFLVHNASEATAYFQIPPGQVVEIGGRTEL